MGDDLDLDPFNALFAVLHARSKDTPGKVWWNATAMHDAIFRALRMDRSEMGAVYAAAAFRIHRTEKGVRVLAAFPCPPLFGDEGDDWLGIERVVSWDPVTDTAEVLGEPGPALIGAVPDADTVSVFGSPFAFLRAFAEARAQWFAGWAALLNDWKRKPMETDLSPGLLLIGKPDAVVWPLRKMPADLCCHGIDPVAVNRATIRQARIPRARPATELRSVA